ncbi:MAG: hypothetical protein IM585_22440 [Pseudanabaena sp. M135S2SP2A07QC]|jgi:hypothetical protein|nr:hypothetical protein [Pseudanabaena sp. M176S2SP2A07QC]MCA6540401.1 hypothetical protein [Pseudanabaena sp. M037S2SP2A07QC]MCA6542506.1 hypothetical protein [Pseudanabaena sp. M074S1SP2A07QC]MCA6547698.1 hypothetical protein [Pseudanabaena sp. M152S2SP2A07QC]MCA6554646.1 hypothetical protein [Pseudanabaena sp. M135S2SP2A07QC]MCA6556631.1 hypothetical protein [Pseudanabaena sp. M114S2SP2A07QC]MCA6566546.1 hypothetical protein [Pseudanabaena sp. M151S2SP2A07QC]MCA6570353.1 hypothetical prot
MLGFFLGILGGISRFIATNLPFIGLALLYLFVQQRLAQEEIVPPLDLIDAKKLDDMVAGQAQEYLRPLLSQQGYAEEEIQQILTRTSIGGPTFRR